MNPTDRAVQRWPGGEAEHLPPTEPGHHDDHVSSRILGFLHQLPRGWYFRAPSLSFSFFHLFSLFSIFPFNFNYKGLGFANLVKRGQNKTNPRTIKLARSE